jgi:hypothetical protein
VLHHAGEASGSLKAVAAHFAEALPGFCRDNGAETTDFEALTAVFDGTELERRMSLFVTDRSGHSSITEYAGVPLKRLRMLDDRGRIRRTPRRAVTTHPVLLQNPGYQAHDSVGGLH